MRERHTTQEPGHPGYKSQPGQALIITHKNTTQRQLILIRNKISIENP